MSNRSHIVLGSLGGAFAIHLTALACSGNHSVVGSRDRDASVADSSAASEHDGSLVDVITSAIDAMGGMVHDVAARSSTGRSATPTRAAER